MFHDKFNLTAAVSPSNAANKGVSRKSNKPRVATAGFGTVTANATGTATITLGVRHKSGEGQTPIAFVKTAPLAP
ncbi:MAG: Ig-like domain-containing protein [Spirochaetaceae bacterium]|nr:Ig-like domain-containing protein [Spirochaetaceae bacterium]